MFSSDEQQLLKLVLSNILVKDRTGEVGIIHGADRFVSTNICLKKKDRQVLVSAYKKLGLENMPKVVSK